MFPPEKLIHFLHHKEAFVSKYVAHYFLKAHDPSPTTPSIVWNAIERLGNFASTNHFHLLGRLQHDEADLERLFSGFSKTRDEKHSAILLSVIQNLPVSTLRDILEQPERVKVLPAKARDRLKHRIGLANKPFDELWDALVKHSENAEPSIPVNLDEPKDLIDALRGFPDQAAERCMDVLSDSSLAHSWIHIHAIEMTGILRHEAAIPQLLDILAGDGDYINDRATEALAQIGTTQVVRQTAERFPKGNEVYRIYAPAVLDQIKLPESEMAALDLLRHTSDLGDSSRLALSLFELCTTEGFEDLYRMTVEGDYTEMFADFEELMLVLCKVQDRSVPELGQWKADVAKRKALQAERIAMLEGKKPRPVRRWRSTSKKKTRR